MDATQEPRPDGPTVKNAAALAGVLVFAAPAALLVVSVVALRVPGVDRVPDLSLYARLSPPLVGSAGALLAGAVVGLSVRDTTRAVGASAAGTVLGYVAVVLLYVSISGLLSDGQGLAEAFLQLTEREELVEHAFGTAFIVGTTATAAVAASELLGTVPFGATERPARGATAADAQHATAGPHGTSARRGPHESRSSDSAMADSESSGADGAS